MGCCNTKSVAPEEAAKHVESMHGQWKKCIDDPAKIIDTAASKRSPFKFERKNSHDMVDLNIGISAVALPDHHSSFGKKYLATIDRVQDLVKAVMPEATKRQTVPHMSLGSIVLDKNSPQEYNDEIARRSGQLKNCKDLLDAFSPPPRAKIQTLKINPDGCLTFQLEHDPAQDVKMTEAELDEALQKIPTCQGEAAAGEKKKFKKLEDGTYTVSRFQQVRMQLGAQGAEIKGMWPSGHMVVMNLVDPDAMAQVPKNTLSKLWMDCYNAWTPLCKEWFELTEIVCLCYVERSLNEGSVVLAPESGEQPSAFPKSSISAASLLGGIFRADPSGDVFIDVEKFEARKSSAASNEWMAFQGEVRELAENENGNVDFSEKLPEEQLLAMFKVYDKDGSGTINPEELKQVMSKLGEKLTDEQLESMMKSADCDGTGVIEYNEFVRAMVGAGIRMEMGATPSAAGQV